MNQCSATNLAVILGKSNNRYPTRSGQESPQSKQLKKLLRKSKGKLSLTLPAANPGNLLNTRDNQGKYPMEYPHSNPFFVAETSCHLHDDDPRYTREFRLVRLATTRSRIGPLEKSRGESWESVFIALLLVLFYT